MDTATRPSDHTREFEALATAIDRVPPDGPTSCPGWTAHDLIAHLVAGAGEMQRLVTHHLEGRPPTPTRSFAEREAPFRSMDDGALRQAIWTIGGQLITTLDVLHEERPTETVAFTGAELTADRLTTHIRSEAAIHRWDLVGDDPISAELLAQRDLIEHGRWALDQMPSLSESARRPVDDRDALLVLWGRR